MLSPGNGVCTHPDRRNDRLKTAHGKNIATGGYRSQHSSSPDGWGAAMEWVHLLLKTFTPGMLRIFFGSLRSCHAIARPFGEGMSKVLISERAFIMTVFDVPSTRSPPCWCYQQLAVLGDQRVRVRTRRAATAATPPAGDVHHPSLGALRAEIHQL